MVLKHYLDNIVQINNPENVKAEFLIFYLYSFIESTFCYYRKTPSIKWITLKCLIWNIDILFRCLNASSRHFIYDNIVSQLKIVRYEIVIHIFFVLDVFAKV